MRVYVDANIYITYLLGQRGEENCNKYFKKSIDCHFSIVCSKTTFAEISMICGSESKLLLQKHIDEFKSAGKLEVVEKLEKDVEIAIGEGETSGLGFNDIVHMILAKRHADIFVTEDRRLEEYASKEMEVRGLNDFLSELKAL
jgi:predicted nucleic acid-binding protein